MDRVLGWTFHQRKHTNGQLAYKNMSNMTNH